MSIQPEGLLSVVISTELPNSKSSEPLLTARDQQDEETSTSPQLTLNPSLGQMCDSPDKSPMFNPSENRSSEMTSTLDLNTINSEDCLNAYINIVNSSSKPIHDEPSSRDPMVETSSSSGSDTNEPVCAQLFNQLNEAYQHLAPDAQALENGGIAPLVGIQLVVPKPPKDYFFMKWNWPLIRRTCFWSLMSILAGCTALVIGLIATMPRRCDPSVEWWQGSLFYEIFPASFQDSSKGGDGIGDLRGITMRLDYVKNLGVKGIRLNSIFSAPNYPEHYFNITSLTAINTNLGTMDDFDNLIRETHSRNMTLMLDLPLHPFIKSLDDAFLPFKSDNTIRVERNDKSVETILEIPSSPAPSYQAIREALLSTRPFDEPGLTSTDTPIVRKHLVTESIKFWVDRGVDGFYLKGLEHFVHDRSFRELIRDWRSVLGPNRILICNIQTINEAPVGARKNILLNKMDLVDVVLRVSNGTGDIKAQIENVTKGILFEKAGYPWVHWSTGSVDTKRVASTLSVSNSSVAIVLLGMMLPGTPSIFYGDEVGMVDCDCEDHQDIDHVHNLAPMFWEETEGSGDKFSSKGVIPWLPNTFQPQETSLVGTIAKMAKLRSETTPIYVNSAMKDGVFTANCEVRYNKDELIVIERSYPRRNTYVLVANLNSDTKIEDMSFLYYGGHVVVGPEQKMYQNLYFKELSIPPGEAFIIKLDK